MCAYHEKAVENIENKIENRNKQTRIRKNVGANNGIYSAIIFSYC
jgi:hypothetical protein